MFFFSGQSGKRVSKFCEWVCERVHTGKNVYGRMFVKLDKLFSCRGFVDMGNFDGVLES